MAALAQCALFFYYAAARIVDGDEGVYTLTSALVMRGELLYRDFFYPQMPLLPYVYGVWMELFGESWHSARFLSALLAVAIGTLLYVHLDRRAGRLVALLGVLLYASSNLVLDWYTTVKSYPLSTFFLFVACVLLERGGAVGRRSWLPAGVLVAFAIDSRLLFAGVLPAFAVAVGRYRSARDAALSFGAGLVAGLLPSLVYLGIDAGRFVWNVFEYQGVRSSGGLVGNFSQKLGVASELVGVTPPDRATGVQGLILVAAAVAAVVWCVHRGRPIPLSLWIAAWLTLVSFLPTPTYSQYFCVVVPFVILGVLRVVGSDAAGFPAVRVALPVVVAVFTWLGGMNAYAEYSFAKAVAQAPAQYSVMRIDHVEDVVRYVDEHTSAGEEVMTSWPGYLLGSHARPVPGFEEHFAPPAAAALSPAEARRYRLVTARQVEGLVRRRRTNLIVYHEWLPIGPKPDWPRALREGNYRLLDTVGITAVYGVPNRYVDSGRPLPAPDLAAELRGPARGAGGRARIYLRDPATGPVLCWSISLSGVRDPVGAKIERAGRVVVPLGAQGPPLLASGCVGISPPLRRSLEADPSRYVVSVYNADFWNGAVRGRLSHGPKPTIYVLQTGGARYAGESLEARLTGAAAGSSGDPYADARATVTLRPAASGGSLCWVISGRVGGRPVDAHLHRAPNGVIGPVALRLGSRFSPTGCTRAPERLLTALEQGPSGYYVDIHVVGSAGARGQLSR